MRGDEARKVMPSSEPEPGLIVDDIVEALSKAGYVSTSVDGKKLLVAHLERNVLSSSFENNLI